MQMYRATLGLFGLIPLIGLPRYLSELGAKPTPRLYETLWMCQFGLTTIVLDELRRSIITSLSDKDIKPLQTQEKKVDDQVKLLYPGGVVAVFQNLTLRADTVAEQLKRTWIGGKERAAEVFQGAEVSETFYALQVQATSESGLKSWIKPLEAATKSLPLDSRTNLVQLIVSLSPEQVS